MRGTRAGRGGGRERERKMNRLLTCFLLFIVHALVGVKFLFAGAAGGERGWDQRGDERVWRCNIDASLLVRVLALRTHSPISLLLGRVPKVVFGGWVGAVASRRGASPTGGAWRWMAWLARTPGPRAVGIHARGSRETYESSRCANNRCECARASFVLPTLSGVIDCWMRGSVWRFYND